MDKYRSYESITPRAPEMGGGGHTLLKVIGTLAAGGVIAKVLFPSVINPQLQNASEFVCKHSLSISNTLREGAPIIDRVTNSPEIVRFMYDAADVLREVFRVFNCY
jgi:hypothetical protein